jgi:signal transduction histidine kinase
VAFSDDQRSAGQAAVLLRSRVVPRRNSILQILDQLAALQSVSLQRHQEEADRLYRQARARLLSVGATTLLIALVVAISASRHVSRLQRQIERARGAEQQNREDLERLSARLVGAQEQERRRLARELHDELGQTLTGVVLELDGLARAAPPELQDAVTEVREAARQSAEDVRDIARGLRPQALDEFGLRSALITLATGFAEHSGLQVRHSLAPDLPALAPEQDLAVYRVAQEGLTNVARHAEATGVLLALEVHNGHVVLRVRDDGRGIDDGAVHNAGGLGGMRERAMLIGGRLAVTRVRPYGTEIVLEVPVEP